MKIELQIVEDPYSSEMPNWMATGFHSYTSLVAYGLSGKGPDQ